MKNGALVQYKGEVLFESKLEPKDYLEIAMLEARFQLVKGFSCRDVAVPMRQTMQIQPILRPWNVTMKMSMATDLEAVTDDIFKVTAKFQGDTIMERGDYLNTIFEDNDCCDNWL